jgi:hypothetical protein
VRLKWDKRFGLHARIEIPREPINGFRIRVNQLARRQTLRRSLAAMLQELNPYLRGGPPITATAWGPSASLPVSTGMCANASGCGCGPNTSVSREEDRIVAQAERCPSGQLVWAEGGTEQFLMSYVPVHRFDLKWMRNPSSPRLLESRMHNERCKSGSESRRGKLAVETPHSAHV